MIRRVSQGMTACQNSLSIHQRNLLLLNNFSFYKKLLTLIELIRLKTYLQRQYFCNLQQILMSEEFTFEQLYHFNWNDSVCLKSHKNLNFTMSDVSKNDIAQKLFSQEPEDNWNAEEFNKKAERKLKNKLNVKNFRQRKKTQQEKLQKRMRHLEAENKMLKMDKFCRNCKKPYGGFIQMSEMQKIDKKEENDQNQFQKYPHEGKQCFEFQKPRLYTKNKKQTNNGSGKIWVALGILMIVIGVHLYGFKGKQGYQDISISKIQSKKWIQIYQNKANGLDDYFNVKLNVKQKSNPNLVQKQKEIFKQIRVFHQGQTHQNEKENEKIARSTFEKLQMAEQRNQRPIDEMDFSPNKQDEVKFHKELLYAIQAQIDDLGHYL